MVSTYHLLVKFLTPYGVGEIRRDQLLARQCYSASLRTHPLEALALETMDSRDEGRIQRAEAIEELLLIALDDQSLDKQARVNSRLNTQDLHTLATTLQQNVDVFAWFTIDMPEISPEVIVHQLNVSQSCQLVRQKRR